jgi:hypothetical protein
MKSSWRLTRCAPARDVVRAVMEVLVETEDPPERYAKAMRFLEGEIRAYEQRVRAAEKRLADLRQADEDQPMDNGKDAGLSQERLDRLTEHRKVERDYGALSHGYQDLPGAT